MHIIEDMPVASQLSTLKVEVLDAAHCPLLGRVPGRITAKYMDEHFEESSHTGHFRLPSLKVHALTFAVLRSKWAPSCLLSPVKSACNAMPQDDGALLSECLPKSESHSPELVDTDFAGGANMHARLQEF